MISTLITVLIVLLIFCVIFWVIDQIGIPAPMNMVVKVILALVLLLWCLKAFGLLSL